MSKRVEFRPLLEALATADVRCVVIGAVAMVLHGADYTTYDVDVCYERSPENVKRLCVTLSPHSEHVRSAITDVESALVSNRSSVPIATDFGELDLLGEVTGLGEYAQVIEFASPLRLNGRSIMVLTVSGLIKAKEALNRLKDQQHLVVLRALQTMNGAI